MERFDVLVVGAGAAGCVVAARLTEDRGRSVLLIEAGPDYGPDPTAWPGDLIDPGDLPADSHPWGYSDAGRDDDRPLPLPRARVIGGSTTINACTWLRGSASDYDRWAAGGVAGWSFDDLLPDFRRAESDPLGGPLHGTNGPVPVWREPMGSLSPVDHAVVEAADRLGISFVDDLNGERDQSPGVGPRPQNVARGRRMNAAFTYLAPARARPNLSILTDTLVDRVQFDGDRAIGVKSTDGRLLRADEIVLAAGAYGSPAILMRSGIGPGTHLHDLGIGVVADRPGVGANLLDHPLVLDGLGPYVVRSGREPAATTTPFLPLMVMASSVSGDGGVDLGVLVGQAFDDDLGGWNAYAMVCLLHSRSDGRVRLTSADPDATLDIRHDHLQDTADLEAMSDGIELAMALLGTPALAAALEPHPANESAPHERSDLRVWLRMHVGTMFHPSGTCRMAPPTDPLGVVDPVGRVYGVANLRVADASIFPTIPRATIHFAVVTAAERLAAEMSNADR